MSHWHFMQQVATRGSTTRQGNMSREMATRHPAKITATLPLRRREIDTESARNVTRVFRKRVSLVMKSLNAPGAPSSIDDWLYNLVRGSNTQVTRWKLKNGREPSLDLDLSRDPSGWRWGLRSVVTPGLWSADSMALVRKPKKSDHPSTDLASSDGWSGRTCWPQWPTRAIVHWMTSDQLMMIWCSKW